MPSYKISLRYTIHTGVVKFFNVGRLYGFIKDDSTGKDFFCHNTGLIDHIKKGDKVEYEIAECCMSG